MNVPGDSAHPPGGHSRHLEPVGVVLAGGESRRMGQEKARLRLGGETLAESALRRLRSVCADVLVADRGRDVTDGLAPSVPDGPGRGPAAGILGAAAARPGRALLVLGCDLPGVSHELLHRIVQEGASGFDWVLPRTGQSHLEPLCAFYGPACLEALRRQVAAERFALHELGQVAGLRIRFLEEDDLRPFGSPEELLANLNTPEDLTRRTRSG